MNKKQYNKAAKPARSKFRTSLVLFFLFIVVAQPIIFAAKTFALSDYSKFSVSESVLSKLYFYSIESCLTGVLENTKAGDDLRNPFKAPVQSLDWFSGNRIIGVSFLEGSLGKDGIKDSKIYCGDPDNANALVKAAFNLWGMDTDYVFNNLVCSNSGTKSGMFTGYGSHLIPGGNGATKAYNYEGTDILGDGKIYNCSDAEKYRLSDDAPAKFKEFIIDKIYSHDSSVLAGASPTLTDVENYWFNREIFSSFCGKTELDVEPTDGSLFTTVKDVSDSGEITTRTFSSKEALSEIYVWGSADGISDEYGFIPSEPAGSKGFKSTTCSNVAGWINATAVAFAEAVKNNINIGKSSNLDNNDNEKETKNPKTCGESVTGIGWIACPLIDGLTKLNDGVWTLVSELLTVNPLTQEDQSSTDKFKTGSNVYAAWGSIRDIANVVFVIIFLIMIFSQMSSLGITNYGIKKLLPRLLVAAILVNVSFLIVQVAVDLANILGSSLYSLLVGLAPEALPTWKALGSLIATVAAGTGVAVAAIAAAGGGYVLFLLILPAALIGALGLLAAILTLIFRQAVIPILAIVAPLAFVANLLPNTESLFKKWKDLLIKMLMMYPLAAIIFGGSQFAAAVIIGDGENWWNYMIGLIVLTAPLFSLPFIASKGGAITDAAGGALKKLVNKASKPINDSFKDRQELARSKYLSGTARPGAAGAIRRNYQKRNKARLTRLEDTKTNTSNFGSQWANSGQGSRAIDRSINATTQSNIDKNAAAIRQHGSTEGKRLLDKERLTSTSLEDLKGQSESRFSNSEVGMKAIDRLGYTKKQNAIDANNATIRQDRSIQGAALNESLGKSKIESHREETLAATRLESNPANTDLIQSSKLADLQFQAAQAETKRITTEATTSVGTSAGISQTTQTGLRNAQQNLDISTSSNNSAQRIQQQDYEDLVSAPDVNDVPNPYAVAAAGIDTKDGRGVQRVQAIAQAAVEKRAIDEINNRRILISSAPGVNKTNLIGHAAEALSKALGDNDSTGVRAAAQILLSSGAPGRERLHEELTDADPTSDSVNAVRIELLDKNVKVNDNILGVFAFTPGISVRELESSTPQIPKLDKDGNIMRDPSTGAVIYKLVDAFGGLTPEELVSQDAKALNIAQTNKSIGRETVESLLNNDNLTKNLAPAKLEIFRKIKAGYDAEFGAPLPTKDNTAEQQPVIFDQYGNPIQRK